LLTGNVGQTSSSSIEVGVDGLEVRPAIRRTQVPKFRTKYQQPSPMRPLRRVKSRCTAQNRLPTPFDTTIL
jgi:hypothetical protein